MLKASGFRKTGANWHRNFDRLIQVFNIQKSQWGDQFYLNLGVYLRDLGGEMQPTEYRCHIRCRADVLVGEEEYRDLQYCLDFDRSLDREYRYGRLRRIVAERLLPWLDENNSLDSLGATMRRSCKGFFILRGVPELLGFEMGKQKHVPDTSN